MNNESQKALILVVSIVFGIGILLGGGYYLLKDNEEDSPKSLSENANDEEDPDTTKENGENEKPENPVDPDSPTEAPKTPSEEGEEEKIAGLAELTVDLDEYTDENLSEAFLDFFKENEKALRLILLAEGVHGKTTTFVKCIYDREMKLLVILDRSIFDIEADEPTVEHSWTYWRNIDSDDFKEGIPWDRSPLPKMSAFREDGRTTLPELFPEEPSLATWPKLPEALESRLNLDAPAEES